MTRDSVDLTAASPDPAEIEKDGYVVERVSGGVLLLEKRADLAKINVEITNACNLNCITCIRNSWPDETGRMPIELFRDLIAQLRRFPKLSKFTFGGFGEPLSHPDFLEMAALAKGAGCTTEMTTNGVLLDAKMAGEVARLVDTVVVSVDALEKDRYAGMRRGGDLAPVLENTARVIREKLHLGIRKPQVGVEFVAMKSNLDQLPGFVDLLRSGVATFLVVTNLLPYTEDMKDEILYDTYPARPGKILNLYDFWPETSGRPPYEGVPQASRWWSAVLPEMQLRTRRYCRFVADYSATVAWDGKVSPCSPLMHSYSCYIFGRRKEMSRRVFGDLRESSLFDIWTSEDYMRFRSLVGRFEFPSCPDCQFADGCAMTLGNEIDCWGNSPSCADCLWARDIIRCL
ncbi:MAG: tungsten cofactor oxidoreductase radical SAM maturase [Chloroflexi bacterium]|nr:tungsten cofactor oxidoreductase radical SAM maturase [Chloroflexota bacterium]